MRSYFTFFRIRFIHGLQYRSAAWAGVCTQFAWGFMTLLMFAAFYRSDPSAFPMDFPALSSYIWLQQAFLALFMAWFFDGDIFDSITSGNVAYELCRPVSIYGMWFVRTMASRVANATLRCVPVLVVAALLPKPYGISLPVSLPAFFLFLLSMVLGLTVLCAFSMLVYLSAFYTISPLGVRILAVSLSELLSGALIPLPFLPEPLARLFGLLPFASTQSTPFLIYNGYLPVGQALTAMFLQVFWLVALIFCGVVISRRALRRVVVQGG